MLLVNLSRDRLWSLMPRGMVAAEIGVALGEHARQIADCLQPRELHLIDPWRFQDVADYQYDHNNTADEEGDRRFAGIKSAFSPEIARGDIVVHRATSSEIASRFPDNYFDWVYIDAVHTFEGCLADLEVFASKVKDDGFICGHDYHNSTAAQEHKFGVVDAVNEFVCRTGFEFTALTLEIWPSYVICKNRDNTRRRDLIRAITDNSAPLIEIRDAEIRGFKLKPIDNPTAPAPVMFSFL